MFDDDPTTGAALRAWFVSILLLVILAAIIGCAHRSLVCTPVKIDGELAMMCADAEVVKGRDIRPYSPAPAPTPQQERLGPHWKSGTPKDQT